MSGLTGSPPPDDNTRADIREVRDLLVARNDMLKKLLSLYEAFGRLADFDASRAMQEGVGPLIDSVNTYNQALWQARRAATDPPTTQPAISSGEADIIKAVAGDVASWVQDQKLKSGSKVIRRVLARITPLLGEEASVYVSLQRVAANNEATAVVELWKRDIGRPHTRLKKRLARFGLDYDPEHIKAIMAADENDNTDAGKLRTRRKEQLKNAIERDIFGDMEEEVQLRADAIDATVAGLRALENEHEKFEKGKPVELASVADYLGRLRHYVELLRAVKEERKPAEEPSPTN